MTADVAPNAPRLRLMRGGDEFVLPLAAAFSVLVLAPFEQHHVRPVTTALLCAMLMFTLWTSDVGRGLLTAAAVVSVGLIVTVVVTDAIADEHPGRLTFSAISVALSLAVIVATVARLVVHPQVTIRTVTGALTVYLLLGLLFCYLFVFVGQIRDDSFFAQTSTGSSVDFLYYSFATLTTVGFGDLTAAYDLGRMLSDLEALIGQLYLVTVVALLVGNIGRRRRVSERRPDLT